MNQKQESTSSPRYHVDNVQRMMNDLVQHIQQDEGRIDDPQALALFEVTREVLKGLNKAFDDYKQKNEKAWKG